MKHIFILNPAAGNGKVAKDIHPRIIEACKRKEVDYEIHRTVSLGDARNFTQNRCNQADGEPIRFYSCGGDGTLNEVLNGLIGYKNAELAVIPSGTGNDFVRNFDNWKLFRDIDAQMDGSTVKIDALEYELLDLSDEDKEFFEATSVKTNGFALNMFNLGFDAQAVAKAAELKKSPMVSGTMAYILGVLQVLIRLKSVQMEVEFQDGTVINGDYLLIGIANGRFSGGGFDGVPQARINDGLLDVSLVKKVTRRFFLSLIKDYHDGTHIHSPKLGDVYNHYQQNKIIIRPEGKVVMAIDGETINTGPVRFNLEGKAVNLVIPKGMDFQED